MLHGAAVAALFLAKPDTPPTLPPIYKVDIIAAPPGERAPGVVTPAPAVEAPPATPETPRRAETSPKDMPPPETGRRRRRPIVPATPVPNPTKVKPQDAARAGGGPEGGKGTDVATVRTEGIEFPYPGYLSNIVRQIAMNFRPRNPGVLKADVFFMIHRDGTVSGFRFISRSGNFAFDLEAQGAVEAAASAKSFGVLPSGFTDDVLPVVFSFDPRIIR
jgi:protein TonB